MATTEYVELSVEVEDKFRISFVAEYLRDPARTPVAARPDRLFEWVDTYKEAWDNGIQLLALCDFVAGFSVVKETRRVVPVQEEVVD